MKIKEILLRIAGVRYVDIFLVTIGSILLFIYSWNFSYIQYGGIIIFSIGLIIWMLGRINIQESYSVVPEAKKLITTGIYSKITHPIYVGSVLFFTGLAIFSLDIFLISFAVFMLIIQIKRAIIEEKVLIGKFGEKYLKHKEQTWF